MKKEKLKKLIGGILIKFKFSKKMNLWILTEERPKKEVLKTIIEKLCSDKNFKLKIDIADLKIIPLIDNNKFTFTYELQGVVSSGFNEIFIKTVSGNGSFVDFIVFLKEGEPNNEDAPLYLIEETKTDDKESRNTGVYQRCSKFIYADFYYPTVPKIMLYNLKVTQKIKPTKTSIFGTRMLLTLGVEIIGKRLDENIFKPFTSVEELTKLKNDMPNPIYGLPVKFKEKKNCMEISAKLEKSGSLSHDPNIGMTTIMASCLRELGWNDKITITQHGLDNTSRGNRNKFIKIANKINISLEGLEMPEADLPENYWKYEFNQEKIGTIFAHLVCEEFSDSISIYENHGGCERGYFIDIENNQFIVIPKYKDKAKYKEGNKEFIINIPDVVLYDKKRNIILNCEGKTYANRKRGVEELKNFDFFEEKFVDVYYPGRKIIRTVVLYGGSSNILNESCGLLINSLGEIILNDKSPEIFKEAIKNLFDLNKE